MERLIFTVVNSENQGKRSASYMSKQMDSLEDTNPSDTCDKEAVSSQLAIPLPGITTTNTLLRLFFCALHCPPTHTNNQSEGLSACWNNFRAHRNGIRNMAACIQ